MTYAKVNKICSGYKVTDSFSFANEISSLPNQSFFMASFDFSSSLVNFPLREVIDIYTNLLTDRNFIYCKGCKFDRINFLGLLPSQNMENDVVHLCVLLKLFNSFVE